MLNNFVITREDDAAGGPGAAQPGGTGTPLPAAEPVGNVGGHLSPAPAAADPGPGRPNADDEPEPGGARPAHTRPDRPLAWLGLREDAADRFVSDYLQMLDGRLDAIRRCLDDSDIEGARVSVLSLESSSKMLGGDTLSARLAELRHQLDLGPTPQRNALLALVEVSAAAFRRDLQTR